MTSKTITGIVSWLRGWFFTKEEIVQKEGALQTQINNKASQSDFNTLSSNVANKLDASDYVVDSALSDSSTNPVQNKVINTALSGKASSSHTHYTDDVEVPQQFPNIGTSQGDSQTEVNGAIDTILGTINTSLSGKADGSHSHGYITSGGRVGSTANKPLITTASGLVTTGSFGTSENTFCQGNDSRLSDARTPLAHNQASSTIREGSALANIGTSANATQHVINSAIDTAIGNLTGADILKVVTTLPTASASTMNALYLLSSNGQYDIYITIEDDGSYSWEKLDDDVLSDLSIDWSDIENKPSTFTPSSHTHGNINANGTISTTIATSSIANFSTLNFPLVRDSTDSAKIKIGLVPTDMVRSSTAYSNIGSSANATQNTINGLIDTAIGGTATKSEVIDWDTLTFVPKATDESGAITFDYLE